MPSVPRRDPTSIKTLGPLPDVSVTTGGATEETFGGGASQKAVGTALEGLSTQAIKLAISQQESVDRTMANDLSNQMVKIKNDITAEVANKFNNAAAVEAPDYIRKNWDERVAPIIESAPNDRVKFLLNKTGVVHKNELDYFGMSHAVNEGQKWKEKSNTDFIKMRIQDGTSNVVGPQWKQITNRVVGEILDQRQSWANEFQIPTTGTPEKTAVYRAAVANDMKELYMGQIKQAVAVKQYVKAEYIQKNSKEWIVGDDAKAIDNLLKGEVRNSQIEAAADALVAFGDDPLKIAQTLDDLPIEIASKVKSQYEIKMVGIGANWNKNASDITKGITSEKVKTAADLSNYIKGKPDGTGVDNEFHALATNFLSKEVSFSKGHKKQEARELQTFLEKYAQTYNSNPVERDKKVAAFRKEVLASKTKLTKDDAYYLLNIANGSVIAQTPDNDLNPFVEFIRQAQVFGRWDHVAAAGAMAQFITRSIVTKPKDLPALAKEVVTTQDMKQNPANIAAGGPTNYSVEKGSSLRMGVPGKSDVKNDVELKPNKIDVIRKSDNQPGKIDRDKFDARIYKRA